MKTLEELVKLENLGGISTLKAFVLVGTLIEKAGEKNSAEGIQKAFELMNELLNREDLSEENRILSIYNLTNNLTNLKRFKGNDRSISDWEQPETFQIILNLRKIIQNQNFEDMQEQFKARVYTNLAGQLSNLGRCIEAIEYWEKALEFIPDFGMALGNVAIAKQTIAAFIEDENYQFLYWASSYRDLEKALEDKKSEEPKEEYFRERFEHLKEEMSLEQVLYSEEKINSFDISGSQEEIKYRKWCLENRLFLNSLNDLGVKAIADRDFLHLASMISKIEDRYPYFHSLFNQLKQEYVTARYLFYEGAIEKHFHFSDENGLHFADKGVHIVNTLDYPAFSINTEKLKLAYRSLYSIFEKISYFLNEYFDLGEDREKVGFHSVQKRLLEIAKSKEEKEDENTLFITDNLPLRGLYWLGRDILNEDVKKRNKKNKKEFHENHKEYLESLEPSAKDLKKVRRYLEHKYVPLHFIGPELEDYGGREKYDLHLSKAEFENKTMKIMKLARSALVYLVYAVRQEELKRKKELDEDGSLTPPVSLTEWDDSWKGDLID